MMRSAPITHATAEAGQNAKAAAAGHGAPKAALWTVRLCFFAVFAVNVQCALGFIIQPEAFVGAYQLAGVAGAAAVSGIGVAFLMWNATYPAFIAAPQRFSVLGWVILAQQAIGLVGESLILAGLPASEFSVLASSIERFIAFDGIGLIAMGASWLWFVLAARHARP